MNDLEIKVDDDIKFYEGLGSGSLLTKVPHPCQLPNKFATAKLQHGAKWKCNCGQKYWLDAGHWKKGTDYTMLAIGAAIIGVLLVLGLIVVANIAWFPYALMPTFIVGIPLSIALWEEFFW